MKEMDKDVRHGTGEIPVPEIEEVRTEAMNPSMLAYARQGDKIGATQALFGWIGGKRLLRETIAARVPEQDKPMKSRSIRYYVEVFGGMAWMLLYKPRWFEIEIYNDLNDDLVNLFNVVKYHPREFYRQIKFLPNSKSQFEYYRDTRQLTDVQRATATYVKYAWSFSSNGESFRYKPASRMEIERRILKLSNRLSSVVLTNDSFERVIKRHDNAKSFLYVDPPYYGYEYLYAAEMARESHTVLRDMLKATRAKWLLSYNDCPEVREFYQSWAVIEEVETTYTAMKSENHRDVKELLIRNYEM